MNELNFQKLLAQETTPEALEETSRYIAGNLKPFLQILEPVLICFPDEGPASLGSVFKRAVEMCGALAIVWGPDYRWEELLRLAFDSHANTIIAHPIIALGLVKMSRATSTPLYVYDMVLSGGSYSRWMIEAVKRGLDCQVWGCYAVRGKPVITGFTCDREAGIHIRDDRFSLRVLNEDGKPIEGSHRGKLFFGSVLDPNIIYDPEETAVAHYQPCSCGRDAYRLVSTFYTGDEPNDLLLRERFLDWASVLDYHATRTESGLKLELVVFPDEALPAFPTCAHLAVRYWDPKKDIPYYIQDHYPKLVEMNLENH